MNDNEEKSKSGKAIAGLVLGIASLLAWLLPICGYPVSILGLFFSVKSLKGENRGKAIAGLVMSIIGLVLTVVNSALGAVISVANMS